MRRNPRVAAAVGSVIGRFPVLDDALAAAFVGDSLTRYERWIAEYDSGDDVAAAGSQNGASLPVVELDADVRAALAAATGEFVVLVDPRVQLRPHALRLVAQAIERHPDATLLYADDDVVAADGTRSDHYFKPDWSPSLLRCQNYVGGFVAVRRSLVREAAARVDAGGAEWLWHFLLELTRQVPAGSVYHLPFVLSEWKGGRPARAEGGARALEQRLEGLGHAAVVEPVGDASYQPHYTLPDDPPLVSIVVPTTCDLGFLRPCVDGILERTSYPRLELLLVANGSRCRAAEQERYLAALDGRPEARVLRDDERPYNFSKVNNRAVAEASGSLVCFLNDDTEVVDGDWLSALVARVLEDGVAAAGAKLLYPNGRIQHAGVILGIGYVAAHAYARKRGDVPGYHDRALVDQDLSCVTAACMLIRKDVFLDVGGFDETLAIAHNDVDLCLRLRRAGWRIVWTPDARLVHRESASIGPHDSVERQTEWAFELSEMHRRWRDELRADPYYNPNLSLDAVEFWEPAFPPRVRWNDKDGAAAQRGAEVGAAR